MKKFIVKTLVFGISFFIVLVPLDYLYSMNCRKGVNGHYAPWEELLAGGCEADVLFCANSRMSNLRTDIADSVLGCETKNLSMIGSPFPRQYYKYQLYRKFNSKPRMIVQNIDMWTLQNDLGYRKFQFYPYFWNKDIREATFPIEPFTFAEKRIPFYRYQIDFLRQDLRRKPAGKVSTWNDTWDPDRIAGWHLTFNITDFVLQLFEDYLTDAEEEDIKMVLVLSPLHKEITDNFIALDRMVDFFDDMAQKHGFTFLDYSRMSLCTDTTCFADKAHLSNHGMVVFSDTLATAIRNLGL